MHMLTSFILKMIRKSTRNLWIILSFALESGRGKWGDKKCVATELQ